MPARKLLMPIAAALALAAPALHGQIRPVDEVRIAVVDPATGRELAVLSPGQELTLPRGEQRLLRLFTPDRAARDGRRPLAATFGFGEEQTNLRIVRSDESRGEAVIAVGPGEFPGRGRPHVGFRIADRVALADDDLRLGRVLVDITEPAQAPSVSEAERVVEALYRGILLRAPDEGAAGATRAIASGGYPALLEQARAIAESRESEIGVYTRGVCNQQRLIELYRHLLGRDAESIDQRTWNALLDQMGEGDIGDLVVAMVQSEEFQNRFGIRGIRRR